MVEAKAARRPSLSEAEDAIRPLLAERFGEDPPGELPASETIRLQLQHRSVRKFTPEPVSDAMLALILLSAQAASHSSNTQCWSVVVVRDADRRRRIEQLLGGNKAYIANASVFLVWVADLHRATAVLDAQHQEMETINYLEGAMVPFVDIGIASQNALLAAQSLGLGGVFVGGLRNNPRGIVDELGLPARTFPALGMAIGHPAPDEPAGIKPRLEPIAVVHHERYRVGDTIDAARRYEERIARYYSSWNVENYSWFRRMAARLGPRGGLNGRHALSGWLREQGFDVE